MRIKRVPAERRDRGCYRRPGVFVRSGSSFDTTVKAEPNKWDPHTPTKMEPSSFPALTFHRRVSHSLPLTNIFIQNLLSSPPDLLTSRMAGPVRSSTDSNRFVQPPRPPNAWILYRSDKLRELPPTAPGIPRRAQAEVSKLISNMWKNETEDIRTQYERRADAKKAEHQAMYPGYRFQPMKKEEKDRLREEKRMEKERERAQSKRARAKSTPYPAGFIAAPFPYPIPYYTHEMQYGPAGPSPPVSAASSPIDSGPYPHHIHDDQVDPLSPDASRSIYPPPLPTSPVSPSSPISRASYPQQMPPTSHGPWPVPAPMLVPPPIPNAGPNAWQSLFVPPPNATTSPPVPTGYSEQISPLSIAQNFVTFNVPAELPQNLSRWVPECAAPDNSFAESIQAFMSGDPSIFQLSEYNKDDLLSLPEGDIEVSVGNLPFSLDDNLGGPNSRLLFSDFDFNTTMAGPSSSVPPAPQPISPIDTPDMSLFFPSDGLHHNPSSSPTHQREFGSFGSSDAMFQYLNFDVPAIGEDVPTQPSPETPSSGQYASPPGYGSSSRRGTWKPQHAGGAPDSPIDRGSPRPWGVPAS